MYNYRGYNFLKGAVSFVVILTPLPQKSPNLFMTTQYNDYYTYAYLREDRTPYYIGKGRGKRAYDKQRTIKPPADKSRILFLKKNLTEAEAFKHEIYMIFVLGRKDLGTGILRNLSNGGEGPSGAVRNEVQKKGMSERMSGALNPNSKAIIAIEPDGIKRHFESISEAARDLKIDWGTLYYLLKNGNVATKGKFKGWQFIYETRKGFGVKILDELIK